MSVVSLRTAGLLAIALALAASLWYAIEQSVYSSFLIGRGHMALTFLAMAAFGISWFLDGQKRTRYWAD